jgi:ABC-2 type transport system permease protein
MLRSIFTKTLRDYRWAILGWGVGMGFLVYAVYLSFTQLNASALSSAALTQLAEQFSFFAEPVKLGTAGGYVTFKYGGLLPLFVGIWAILAGARMVRGEEERGTMDILLATPRTRVSLLLQKIGALVVALLLIGVLIGLFALAGQAGASVAVDPAASLLYGLDVSLTALLFGLLALVLSQFMGRFAAASWAGGLMVVFFLLDGTGRTVQGLGWLQRVSPFFYYQLSKPLIASYGTNAGALLVLVGLCALAVIIAVPLFAQRDVNRTVFADVTVRVRQRAVSGAQRSAQALAAARRGASVRGVWMQALRRQRATMFWWITSLFVFTVFLVLITRTIQSQIQTLLSGASPAIAKLLGGENLATNAGFLAGVLFLYLPLLVSLFAGLLAYNWVSDLNQGRLELVLSTPVPRWRALLERFAAVVIATVGAAFAIWLAILAGAQISGLSLDVGHVTMAAVGLLPLELVTASLVYALAGVLQPGLVLGVLSVFLGLSFLVDVLRAVFNLPEWVTSLSIFEQYGTPITDGLNWGAFFAMLAVAAILLLISETQFTSRDVASGAA